MNSRIKRLAAAIVAAIAMSEAVAINLPNRNIAIPGEDGQKLGTVNLGSRTATVNTQYGQIGWVNGKYVTYNGMAIPTDEKQLRAWVKSRIPSMADIKSYAMKNCLLGVDDLIQMAITAAPAMVAATGYGVPVMNVGNMVSAGATIADAQMTKINGCLGLARSEEHAATNSVDAWNQMKQTESLWGGSPPLVTGRSIVQGSPGAKTAYRGAVAESMNKTMEARAKLLLAGVAPVAVVKEMFSWVENPDEAKEIVTPVPYYPGMKLTPAQYEQYRAREAKGAMLINRTQVLPEPNKASLDKTTAQEYAVTRAAYVRAMQMAFDSQMGPVNAHDSMRDDEEILAGMSPDYTRDLNPGSAMKCLVDLAVMSNRRQLETGYAQLQTNQLLGVLVGTLVGDHLLGKAHSLLAGYQRQNGVVDTNKPGASK